MLILKFAFALEPAGPGDRVEEIPFSARFLLSAPPNPYPESIIPIPVVVAAAEEGDRLILTPPPPPAPFAIATSLSPSLFEYAEVGADAW